MESCTFPINPITIPYSISVETDNKLGVFIPSVVFCKNPQYPILSLKIINDPDDVYKITFGNSEVNITLTEELKVINPNLNNGYTLTPYNKFIYPAETEKCNKNNTNSKKFPVMSIDFEIINFKSSVIHKDIYGIKFNICNDLILRGVIVDFNRLYNTNLPLIPLITLIKQKTSLTQELIFKTDMKIIPYIIINGQTLIDFSDAGNMIFTIGDKFTYYEKNPLVKNNCVTPYPSNDIKITKFDQSCPLMVSVLKGKGCNLIIKASTLTTNKPFPEFYLYLILYGMLKYILSKILYGEFDINYLLRKNNKRFLKDLGNSRFCSFLQLFNNPESQIFGYDKYFKYCI